MRHPTAGAGRGGEDAAAVVGDGEEILVGARQRLLEGGARGGDVGGIEPARRALLRLGALLGDRGHDRRVLADEARGVLEAGELVALILEEGALGLLELRGDDAAGGLARGHAERNERGGDEDGDQRRGQPGELDAEGERRETTTQHYGVRLSGAELPFEWPALWLGGGSGILKLTGVVWPAVTFTWMAIGLIRSCQATMV